MKRVLVEIPDKHADYIDACARIRDTSRTRLVERLLDTIASDQLVLAILDDGGLPIYERGKHRWRQGRMKVDVDG